MDTVSVQYKLHLAESGPRSQTTHSFPVPSSTSHAIYYQGLTRALRSAIHGVGDDLTAWRDAVGGDEKHKEAGGGTSSTDE